MFVLFKKYLLKFIIIIIFVLIFLPICCYIIKALNGLGKIIGTYIRLFTTF